jgi:NADPH:quinone reductase-like Zn-dependent oxidoreductase
VRQRPKSQRLASDRDCRSFKDANGGSEECGPESCGRNRRRYRDCESPLVDAVGDTVNGKTAEKLIAKLMPGGLYALVVGAPRDARNYSAVKVVTVVATPHMKTLGFMAKAVRDGELVIPISRKLPLSKVGEAQAAAAEGGIGKVLLVA